MNMYKRIMIIVSCILFSLFALLAVIVTDLNDRDFPQAIGTKSRITIRFNQSEVSINEAFLKLATLDSELNLGLVKIVPDFDKDGDREVFAAFSDNTLPNEFTWFRGNDKSKIVHKNRLNHSFPDGIYLVTNNTSRLDEFVDHLQHIGAEVVRRDATVLGGLQFVITEKGFITAILASLALLSSLALFWLSIKAKARALRVLGGSPLTSIQLRDITAFCRVLFIAAGTVAILSTSYIGIFHGVMYVGMYLKIFISLQALIIIFSIFIALVMSAATWPSTKIFATRQPPVKRLRLVALIIKALTFVLVISTIGPTWSTYQQSSVVAAEMAQWKNLSDQVSIVFSTNSDEINRTEEVISRLVKDAELNDMTALSYTYTKDMMPSVDFHHYSAISFVNEQWIRLVTKEMENNVVTPISKNDIPKNLIHEIKEELDILSGGRASGNLFEQLNFQQTAKSSKLPVILGGGDGSLYFGDDILFVVVPSLYDTYNDSNLTSLISSSNIIFTGVTATEKLLKQHHLDVQSLRSQGFHGELRVVRIAEEGILRAQYMAYLAWLQNLSFITLLIAFTIAAAISAFITATLQAKRDFPLRLAGKPWIRIIQKRISKEIFVGITLLLIVIILQRPSEVKVILITAGYGLFIATVSHIIAVQWCFNGVSRRRI